MKRVERNVVRALAIVVAVYILATQTGCMQVTGAKRINAWGFEIESNSGFEVSAGAMQYDHALERKGSNIEATDNRKSDRY